MPVSNGETLRAVARFQDEHGSFIHNVFTFKMGGNGTTDDANIMARVLEYLDDVYSVINTSLPDTLNPYDYTVHTVVYNAEEGRWDNDYLVGNDTLVLTADPSSTDQGTASQTAATLYFPSERIGSRGRKAVGPLAESAVNDGILETGALSNFVDFAANMLVETFIGDGLYLLPRLLSTIDGEAYKMLSGFVSAVTGTIRSRKPGVGA